jgi:hypothetical protein
VNRKKYFQCQIVCVTSQDRKDAVFVIVIFSLMKLFVLVALRTKLKVNEYGSNDDILWNVILNATLTGT